MDMEINQFELRFSVTPRRLSIVDHEAEFTLDQYSMTIGFDKSLKSKRSYGKTKLKYSNFKVYYATVLALHCASLNYNGNYVYNIM